MDGLFTMNPGSPPTSDGHSIRTGHHGGRGPGRAGCGSRRTTTATISRQRFDGATEDLKGESSIWLDRVPLTCLSKPKKPSPATSAEHTNIPVI